MKILAKCIETCYTYDELNRVISRVIKECSGSVLSKETFDHDAAGNVTEANGDAFVYDTNNRLVSFNGQTVSYDLDGNMLSDGVNDFTYDCANRLISAGGHTYTYNAENVRIRDLCSYEETTYTYDTNCKLSRLLVKTTNGTETKYVYGRGLIGEERNGSFKVYHFDCRGSTIALTDASGNITDTFKYDTYGKLIERTGNTDVIFGYNGRDGVITEDNGLIYMRARYYSPDMKRFINADIVAGGISNAVTLNRFAYANGNPVSFVDPFGLSAEDRSSDSTQDNIVLILYDPENFSRQANDEGKYWLSKYDDITVIKKPISSKDDFIEIWNEYSDSATGISLIFHGSPNHIWVGESFMAEEVSNLNRSNAENLRLLSCNGGHKDVEGNIANAFKSNHDIKYVYAMDGNLSFYPRNWYLIGHDYSKYGPRLSFNQNGFKEHASEKKILGFIFIKRKPTGFYLVE